MNKNNKMNVRTLLHPDEETIAKNQSAILKIYGKTEAMLTEDLNIIRKWVLAQPHFPEVMGDNKIIRFLYLAKFSIEKTKSCIDMYYTTKTLIPDFYENKNPKTKHMKEIADIIYCVPLPKLTDDLCRVHIFKINRPDEENMSIADCIAHVLHIAEVRITEEVSSSDILLFDLETLQMSHIRLLAPMLLKKMMTVLEKVFSNRMREIHLINCPSYADVAISLFKTALNPKLVNRIHVHKTLDSLYNSIPRRILPIEYGGEEISLSSINYLWQMKLEEYQEHFDKLDTLRVNEKLRPNKLINDEILGYHGNFKKLSFD